MKTSPFMNNVLIEVTREFDNVSRSDENETLKTGKIVDVSVSQFHMTASAFGELSQGYVEAIKQALHIGATVRWEEFAEGGQTFEEDGKTYALIPFWRLISITEEN